MLHGLANSLYWDNYRSIYFFAGVYTLGYRPAARVSPFPRVPPIDWPDDVESYNYSKTSVKRRNEVGLYRSREYDKVSTLSAARIMQLADFKNSRGHYLCPFCRQEEAQAERRGYDDIEFSRHVYT